MIGSNDNYEEKYYYLIHLLNDEYELLELDINLHELKNLISENDFIVINEGKNNEWNLFTKSIKGITDRTEREREIRRDNENQYMRNWKIVREIREVEKNLNKFWVRLYGLQKNDTELIIDTINNHNEDNYYDKLYRYWIEKDNLMKYNQNYLNKILSKCRKRVRK